MNKDRRAWRTMQASTVRFGRFDLLSPVVNPERSLSPESYCGGTLDELSDTVQKRRFESCSGLCTSTHRVCGAVRKFLDKEVTYEKVP